MTVIPAEGRIIPTNKDRLCVFKIQGMMPKGEAMKVTSKGRYALRAIIDIVTYGRGNPITLLDISNRQNISVHYLEQLFRKLKAHHVVRAVRGPGGGYVLAAPMDDITVQEILLAVGENTQIDSDMIGSDSLRSDSQELALLKDYFANLAQTIRDYFATTSIGDLVRRQEANQQKTEKKLSLETLFIGGNTNHLSL